MEQAATTVDIPKLRYRPGVYALVSVHPSVFDEVEGRLACTEWFQHDPDVHPFLDVGIQTRNRSLLMWIYQGDGRHKIMGNDEDGSSIECHLYDHLQKERFQRTGHQLFVEDNGKAWSATYTEKMRQFKAGKGIGVCGNEMMYEPDGQWMIKDFEVRNPNLSAVQREIAGERFKLEAAEETVRTKEQALEFARKDLERTRVQTAERMQALMGYLKEGGTQ